VLYDRGADSAWRARPTQLSGGGGLISTSLDYHRFCRMCLNGGELDGMRLLGRKTIELMTMNHLPGGSDLATLSRSMFSEATNAGVGFGLGFAVTINVAPTLVPGSVGEFYWGGMFSTAFHIDPVERLIFIFMTQLSPSSTWPVRRELKTMIYSSITRSAAC
jgi:CubicO group peptidase (beta-lactamase class C family)